ncbi:MAG TPA: PBP1A family penicillin-binding protein [Ignavibacteriales bacterium]|nr:PBP1A family penicillin-binding protein [Ignavibacteriales bacterium]HRR18601.1 PBP1A family penicillin-binding protein [Ignavibacteriales bacterium]
MEIKKKRASKFIIFSLIIIAILFSIFMLYVFSGLPSLEELENPKPVLASKVFSEDGELIGQFFIENRIETNVDSLPKHLIYALYATEDRTFESHWGVDLVRFIKAMVKNVINLSVREGASTITQQLAKNLYKLKDKNENLFQGTVRKIREWITAIQIERTYTKKEILEMYLNISYFGRGAYGIETAAQIYFNKKAKDLSITESALMIAQLKSPTNYDPVNRYNNALRRRNQVLYNMMDEGYISEADYNKLKNLPIVIDIKRIKTEKSIAPHFLEYVRQQMEKLQSKYGFDLYRDGINIYTSLNAKMQRIANQAVEEHISEYQKLFDKSWNWNSRDRQILLNTIVDEEIKRTQEYKEAITYDDKQKVYNKLKNDNNFIENVKRKATKIQTGFVVIDPYSGQIKAMVGGSDFSDIYGLNHVTQIRRQPGSSFKPIIYATAIEDGLYPAYAILNQPITYGNWTPRNSDGSTGGMTMLRDALRMSLNIITARLIIEGHAPLGDIDANAQKLGITTKLNLYPSLALGTSEVIPLELVGAYSAFVNKGIFTKPISILKLTDKDGILIDNFTTTKSIAFSEETAAIMTDMMKDVVDRGTAAGIRQYFNYPAAGKTGTTQNFSDAWFIGYTPSLVAGAWVGFDDHRIKFTGWYGQGAKAAAPIWAKFMAKAYQELNIPVKYFELPSTVETIDFCAESIMNSNPMRATGRCPSVITDIVSTNHIPPSCTIHGGGGD